MHSALLNRVLLDALTQVDLLATLALSYCTSHNLDDFVFNNVISASLIASFLRQHQYALFHDSYKNHFSPREVALLRYAVRRLQAQLDHDSLFNTVGEFLGPLIACTPVQMFFKSPQPSPEFSIALSPDARGRFRAAVPLSDIQFQFKSVLATPWMYATWYLEATVDFEAISIVNKEEPHPILNDLFLFSKRYIDLYNLARQRTASGMNLRYDSKPLPSVVLAIIDEISTTLDNYSDCNKLSTTFCTAQKKWWLFAFLEAGMSRKALSATSFEAVFEREEWKILWTPAELGRFFAFGLRNYGSSMFLEAQIKTIFASPLEGLLWLFLGAHGWFRTRAPRVMDYYADDAMKICCDPSNTTGIERKYLINEIESLGNDEKIWLVTKAVRLAPEYGVCRDLGANLFNYFVVSEPKNEANNVFNALVQEICSSRMQYLFEHVIGLAIANSDVLPSPDSGTQYLKTRLLIKNGELYQLLDGQRPITPRMEFYESDQSDDDDVSISA